MADSDFRTPRMVHMVQGVVQGVVQGQNGLRAPWCRVVQGIAYVYTRERKTRATRETEISLSCVYTPCTTLHTLHHSALTRVSVVQGAFFTLHHTLHQLFEKKNGSGVMR